MKENVRDLIGFIHRSPSPYHVVRNLEEMFSHAGFTKLSEGRNYRLEKGGSYFVSRNGSALIAFRIPQSVQGFSIVSAHTDSPSFRVKDNPEIRKDGYITLNVEGYGGMLLTPGSTARYPLPEGSSSRKTERSPAGLSTLTET